MHKALFAAALLAAALLTACHRSDGNISGADEVEGEMAGAGRDVIVPKVLVGQIERDYLADFHKANPYSKASDGEVIGGIRRKLIDFEVMLRPLIGRSLAQTIRFLPPSGGGVIDLKDYVVDPSGSFGVQIITPKLAAADGKKMKVYYVSRAKKRTVLEKAYGSGCGRFGEISGLYKSQIGPKGLEVYAADQRYLSVVGGTFIFVISQPPDLRMGTITFTDSRYPDLACGT